MNREQVFALELDQKSSKLYTKHEWEVAERAHKSLGISFEYYEMQCEVFDSLYEDNPGLFDNYQWINAEDGMPLWVRPGVEWIPDYRLDD
jgi:hypothetical protein